MADIDKSSLSRFVTGQGIAPTDVPAPIVADGYQIPALRGVRVLSDKTNTDNGIQIGRAGFTDDAFLLYPGQYIDIPVDNVNLVNVLAVDEDQKYYYIYL
jgi:hypothetical protein